MTKPDEQSGPVSNLDAQALRHLDFGKGGGLLPVVVQHCQNGSVLMVGYMNADALTETIKSGKVTFYSRSKQRLWVKGETSGHFLLYESMHADCDNDAIVVRATPLGPTCHNGTASCFGDVPALPLQFLSTLESLIAQRDNDRPADSYTTQLLEGELRRIAQKVGEEGVETALAGVCQDERALRGESADLIFHLMVLLRARKVRLEDVVSELQRRHQAP